MFANVANMYLDLHVSVQMPWSNVNAVVSWLVASSFAWAASDAVISFYHPSIELPNLIKNPYILSRIYYGFFTGWRGCHDEQ